jgi:hypothetical protein
VRQHPRTCARSLKSTINRIVKLAISRRAGPVAPKVTALSIVDTKATSVSTHNFRTNEPMYFSSGSDGGRRPLHYAKPREPLLPSYLFRFAAVGRCGSAFAQYYSKAEISRSKHYTYSPSFDRLNVLLHFLDEIRILDQIVTVAFVSNSCLFNKLIISLSLALSIPACKMQRTYHTCTIFVPFQVLAAAHLIFFCAA